MAARENAFSSTAVRQQSERVRKIRFPLSRLGRLASLVLTGAAIYLYAILFRFPGAPVLLGGDQTYCWMNGQRILYGEHVYRDFFQFTPPGADLVYFTAFRLFGARMWVASAMVLLLGVALCWLCLRVAAHVSERRLAVLASSFFVVVLYGTLLNATHHWFSVLLILMAVALVLPRRSRPRLATAGALTGLASFFTQSHGVAACAAIAAFLIWERFQRKTSWRKLAWQEGALLIAALAVVLALNAHYLASVGLAKLWFFQVTYIRQYLPLFRGPFEILPRGWVSRRLTIAVHVLVSLVYGIGLFRLVRSFLPGHRAVTERERRIMLLVIVGGALFLEVILSLNFLRLYAVSLPAAILLAVAVGRAGRMRPYAAGSLWLVIGCIAGGQVWLKQWQPMVVATLPGGRVALPPQAREKLSWIAARTKPGDFFLHAAWPGVYLPLGLRNPLFLDVISTYQLTPRSYVERAVLELESKRVRYVLWTEPPVLRAEAVTYLAPLRAYLQEQYRCSHIFKDGDELLERK